MFDKFIDLLVQFIGLFKPFTVVNPANRAVIVRSFPFTKQKIRQVGPGFHWLWPLGIEDSYYLSLATRVDELAAKSLVTQDGRTVSVGVVVTYRVHDVEKAIFSVYEPMAAISDAVQGEIARIVASTDYADLNAANFTETCRKRGFKYGFEIDDVRISTLSPTRTIHLINSTATD